MFRFISEHKECGAIAEGDVPTNIYSEKALCGGVEKKTKLAMTKAVGDKSKATANTPVATIGY